MDETREDGVRVEVTRHGKVLRSVPRRLEREDYEAMGLPPLLRGYRLEGVPESARAVVGRYCVELPVLVNRGVGLALSGLPGVGKTGSAAVVAKYARAVGLGVYFTSVPELREALKGKLEYDTEVSVWERVRGVDLLVLDNLREEDAKAMWLAAKELEDLLTHRSGWGRPTILTTRLPLAQRAALFPQLVEASRDVLLEVSVTGPNLREAQAEANRALLLETPPTPGVTTAPAQGVQALPPREGPGASRAPAVGPPSPGAAPSGGGRTWGRR